MTPTGRRAGHKSNNKVQVLIVGLGPAGTACGTESAKSGLDVLAIDRAHFPRDNICGDALTGDALRFLRENNLPSKIIQRSVSVTRKPS
ncbi:FAD-dependent oxidoreductase [Synechococcus sp. A18-25c]|nr:FAD-dependent oxidoreductase [Synechococcus sp. A18-25c]